MSTAEMQSLNRQINEFKARKAEEFPDLDLRVCDGYENDKFSLNPRFSRDLKQLIKRY